MYRTLYFRYTAQKRFNDVLTLLFEGAKKFLDTEQRPIAADLAILIVDTLEKHPEAPMRQWVLALGELFQRIGPNVVEREAFLTRSIKWVASERNQSMKPKFHEVVASVLWDEGNLELAKHHFLLSHDGVEFGKMLIQLSAKGYSRELDLFIAHTVLQQLCLKQKDVALETFETYTKYHPKIACTEPPFTTPLLNFIFFLLKAIDTGKLAAFKALCDLYKPSTDRDPAYEKYLQKIGVIFFNAPQPRQSAAPGGIFGDLINQLFQTLDDDGGQDDEEVDDDGDLD